MPSTSGARRLESSTGCARRVTPRLTAWSSAFNGRISEVIAQTRFACAEELETTLTHYAATYNHRIPQRALDHLSPVQALKQWRTRRPDLFVKRVYEQSGLDNYGASLTKSMYTTSGYRVYGQQQVIPDDFTVGDYYISEDKYEEMRRYTVFEGDVLVSVMGTIGKVAVVPPNAEPGIINPRLVRYRCGSQIRPRFLQRILMCETHQEHLNFEAKGSTMDGLNMTTLATVPIPVPPVEEQDQILAGLFERVGWLDSLVNEAESAIALLQERRSALISAAVTGKIDVRQAA